LVAGVGARGLLKVPAVELLVDRVEIILVGIRVWRELEVSWCYMRRWGSESSNTRFEQGLSRHRRER
jgi:hypothetical protein